MKNMLLFKSSGKFSSSFTLIELLIVIAILAVLMSVIVITINPTEMLKRTRDVRRLSDLKTLNTALLVYSASNPDGFFGNLNTVYISIPDSSPTCANLGLPPLPTGWSYACSDSTNYRKTDGTGWIPINFKNIDIGSPISALPIDPINSTSTGQYYTYVAGGSWKLAGIFESSKYSEEIAKDGGVDPVTYEIGTNLNFASFTHGLIAYWSFDEGSGTAVYDYSGYGYNGTMYSSTTIADLHTVSGCKANACIILDGIDDYARTNINSGFNTSISFWAKSSSWLAQMPFSFNSPSYSTGPDLYPECNKLNWNIGDACANSFSNSFYPNSDWHHLVIVNDKQSAKAYLYLDGNYIGQANWRDTTQSTSRNFYIGKYSGNGYHWQGLLDEFRIYSRVFTAAEVKTLYDATK